MGTSTGAPAIRDMTRGALVLALAALGGACWGSHGRGSGTDAGRTDAATPADAARRDAARTDAGSASGDGATPLPPEPEPDLGPDARPSDYPEASEWTDPDPSRFPAGDPCCRPVGEPRAIRMADSGSEGIVDLEWNGREWGLLFTNTVHTVFLRLDEMGTPEGSEVDLGLEGMVRGGLSWGGGRYGVALLRGPFDPVPTGDRARVGLIDSRGVLASEWARFGNAFGIAVARVTHTNRWAVGWRAARGELLVREMDASARFVGEPRHLAWHIHEHALRLVGLRSRVVAVWASDEGVQAQVLTLPLESSPGTVHPLFEPELAGGVSATDFRDLAVVADVANRGVIRMTALHPWDGRVVLRRELEAPLAQGPGLGASSSMGLVAMCVPTLVLNDVGMPETSEIWLRLFGPDLAPLGAPARVTAIDDRDFRCEVGFSPRGLLVAWWDPAEPVVWVQLFRLG